MLQLAVKAGRDARVCDYDWVLDIREQCVKSKQNIFGLKIQAHFSDAMAQVEKNKSVLRRPAWRKELGIDIFGWKKVVLTETAP